MSEQNDCEQKILFVVDELDRCRPTYAIETLETIKHLFDVKGVVFVLAVDKIELANSIKAVYGSEFSADSYLERFFDLTINLPISKSEEFTLWCLESLGLDKRFSDDDEFQESLNSIICDCLPDSMVNYRRRFQILAKFALATSGEFGQRSEVKFSTLFTFLLLVLREADFKAFSEIVTVKDLDSAYTYIEKYQKNLSECFGRIGGTLLLLQPRGGNIHTGRSDTKINTAITKLYKEDMRKLSGSTSITNEWITDCVYNILDLRDIVGE